MRKSNLLLTLLFLISTSIVFLFQNCSSGIQLQTIKSTARILAIPPRSAGEFCTPENVEIADARKTIILLDMSASNTYKKDMDVVLGCDSFGVPEIIHRWFMGQEALDRCTCIEDDPNPCDDVPGTCNPPTDPSECRATDLSGERFVALLNYLDPAICSRHANPLNTFAIIGFSDFMLAPIGFGERMCTDTFVPLSVAVQEIQGLNTLQTLDIAKSGEQGFADPFDMNDTSYLEAFKCMDKRITENINPQANFRQYNILFLTDGQPSDRVNGQPAPLTAYTDKLQAIKNDVSARNHTLTFQPIYYGFDDGADDSQHQQAIQKLNAMLEVIHPGEDKETIFINPTSTDFATQLQQELCNTDTQIREVAFTPFQGIQVIGLTSQQINDQLYADSDMDGLNDDYEEALDFEPNNPRTFRILDSLCWDNRELCQEYFDSNPTCNENLKVGFGFNDCDKKFVDEYILRIDANPNLKDFDGLDYDRDTLLDFVELSKGFNMFLKNDYTTQQDGDTYDALSEIFNGTDPLAFTSPQTIDQFGYTFTFGEQNSCSTNSGYSVGVSKLPFISNLNNVANPNFVANPNGDNIYALLFFARLEGFQTDVIRVFARYLTVQQDQTLTISPELVDLGTLELE